MAKRSRTITLRAGKARRGSAERGAFAPAGTFRCLQMAYTLQPAPQAFDDLAFAIDNEEITRLLREIADIESERLDRLGRVLARHHANDN